jgi:hypothetical protein
MLSDHEQRVWDDVERFWAEEAVEPPRPVPLDGAAPRDPGDPPALVVAGVWSAILLIIFGVPAAGLSIGAATALGWALWRYWPQRGRTDATGARSVLEEVHRGLQAARRPVKAPRPRPRRPGPGGR